jgi:DNA-binding NtrC family response regulator
VEKTGKAEVTHNGVSVETATFVPGDLLEIRKRLLLLCTRRPAALTPFATTSTPVDHPFGEPDDYGIVGESPLTWRLREQVGFLAKRSGHVLVRGPSGTGKELVAQALHARSSRGEQLLVSRNAATIPAALMDAELFGNVKNYPNPGMADRPGLVGEASGSTLFLDEFAELPVEQQAHLLRVLDDGEYHRLGESKASRADIRLVAATNRPDTSFKADVLARLKLRLDVPGLGGHVEDVPLLARHLLRRIAAKDADLAARFFEDSDSAGEPRMCVELVTALMGHSYKTHVRELEALLWKSMLESRGDRLDVWESSLDDLPSPEPGSAAASTVDPNAIEPEAIQACLDKHQGKQEPVWRELGLSSRHVLTRLVKKHGLAVRGRTTD